MDRLPKESLVPEIATIRELHVGEGCWVNSIQVDSEGVIYLRKKEERLERAIEKFMGQIRRNFRVVRKEEGWLVQVPEEHLPFKRSSVSSSVLGRICFVATEIEIIEK